VRLILGSVGRPGVHACTVRLTRTSTSSLFTAARRTCPNLIRDFDWAISHSNSSPYTNTVFIAVALPIEEVSDALRTAHYSPVRRFTPTPDARPGIEVPTAPLDLTASPLLPPTASLLPLPPYPQPPPPHPLASASRVRSQLAPAAMPRASPAVDSRQGMRRKRQQRGHGRQQRGRGEIQGVQSGPRCRAARRAWA
jgi:hypothetical protein